MGRLGKLLKFLFWIGLVGFVGLAIYALVSDLPAPVEEISVPLTPSGQGPGS